MLDRLAALERRFDEIEGLLADPEISADYSRVQDLLKEQASMRTVVGLSREYRSILGQIEDARAMLRESDHEMTSLAREELSQLEPRLEQLEKELRLALIPRDPNDEKNVIMEIRAGTGGDEAGLFAADL
ncbi:MAG: PCRF domain-containing protein, partial [Chloroflexi bacterium]|nr:PCRF domain-containing protein [Chloroflexota bacterium]